MPPEASYGWLMEPTAYWLVWSLTISPRTGSGPALETPGSFGYRSIQGTSGTEQRRSLGNCLRQATSCRRSPLVGENQDANEEQPLKRASEADLTGLEWRSHLVTLTIPCHRR